MKTEIAVKYAVYNNDKPAILYRNGCGWDKYIFNTFGDAVYYASIWIYLLPSDGNIPFELNIPYDYSGCGDFIVIKELKTE